MQNSDWQKLSMRRDQSLLHIYEDVPKLIIYTESANIALVAN